MKARRRIIVGALAMLAAFAVFGMITLNIRLAVSATNANTTSSTANSFSHGQVTDFDAITRKICFHVNDRVGLASTLSWEIREALRAANRFDVYLVNNEPGTDDRPLLLVEITNPKVLWTPLYGTATFDVKYVYATDTTDPKLLHGTDDHFESDAVPEKFQLRARGTISVSDTTKGLITLPAYRKHLAEGAAKTIVEGIVKALNDLKVNIEKNRREQEV